MDFSQDDASEAGVTQEAIGAPVATHGDVGHGVDPQPGLQAGRKGEIENFDVVRNFSEYWSQFGGEEFEARMLCIAHVDHHVIAVGKIVLHLADGRCQRRGGAIP